MTEDLDRWLATELMGWVLDPATKLYCDGLKPVIAQQIWHPFDPKTGQIWLCVERMRERGWWLILQGPFIGNEILPYVFHAELKKVGVPEKSSAKVNEGNPAIAICKAIKAALTNEKEEPK